MATRAPQAAVCIIAIELGEVRMSLSVRTVRNLDRNLYSARPEAPRRCANAEEALRVAGTFLHSLENEMASPDTTQGR